MKAMKALPIDALRNITQRRRRVLVDRVLIPLDAVRCIENILRCVSMRACGLTLCLYS